MEEELKLDTLVQRISFLYDSVPEVKDEPMLLVLIYWRIFDEISIPDWLIQEIADKASNPDSIMRVGRKVASYSQLQALIASVNKD